ncbi:MAG: glycosyltransferase family 87 protein, partial [Acidobacteriota bacterium]
MRAWPAVQLRRSFCTWQTWPARRHALALALLLAVAVVRWGPWLFAATPLDDEAVYLVAFAARAAGEPVYTGIFFYPPPFADAGAWLLERFGTTGVLAVLRAINVAGLALLVWIAAAWLPLGWRGRVLAATLVIALSPAVRLGLQWGNLSFAVAGPLVLGVLWAARRPLTSALMLGLGLVIKPLAPGALVVLAVVRPRGARWSRQQTAAVLGGALALALLLATPGLIDFLDLRGGKGVTARNASLHRVVYSVGHAAVGAAPSALALAALIALATAAIGGWLSLRRRRACGPASILSLATTVALLATPLLWSHSLLLSLPTQMMAVAIAASRRAQAEDAASRRARDYEIAVVVLRALAIHLSEGVGALDR